MYSIYVVTTKHPLFQEKRHQNVAHSETPLEGGANNCTKFDIVNMREFAPYECTL